MESRFDRFFARLMKYEGGATITRDPVDPGGVTRYGISKKAHPGVDVENLDEATAKQIYLHNYYDPLLVDEFTDEQVAWQVFDFGVNAGKKTAIMTLQRCVSIYPDGLIGPLTIHAANNWNGEYPLHVLYKAARTKHYQKLVEKNESLHRFYRGWVNRVNEL